MNARASQGQSRLMQLLHGRQGAPWGTDPGDLDPEAIAETIEQIDPLLGTWFRLDARGWEHVPEAPVMVVSNHSGGTTIPDAWGLLVSWYERFGVGRPIHPMTHELVLSNRFTGQFMAKRGVLRASGTLARRVLTQFRHDLLVMPGGDVETWRTYADRYQVRFDGRKGYARLAKETGVPIVPVAHAGAHETLIVLSTGKRLARALQLPRLVRAEIWPIHLSLPWGLAIGPLPHLPTPALLRYRIAPPVEPVGDIDVIDREVRARVQEGLDDLAAERAVFSERVVDSLKDASQAAREWVCEHLPRDQRL